MNLGENDMHTCGSTCNGTFFADLTEAYVSFVTHIASVYPEGANVTFALVIAPHEVGTLAVSAPVCTDVTARKACSVQWRRFAPRV
jgi:hypothetical protein